MSVLVVAEIPGGTIEQYEAVSGALGFREPGFEAPGLVEHTAGNTGDGNLIVDVWDSPEDFQRLMADAAPAIQDVGVPPFEPRVLPVHNTRKGRGDHAGVIVLIEAPGFGTEQYDKVIEHMEAHSGDGTNHPALTHTAAVSYDGMVFVDVWDSPESFGRFAETELGPAAAKAGEDLGGLEPRFVPVHYRQER
jgi:heme-degrading monooxygenase HmoA